METPIVQVKEEENEGKNLEDVATPRGTTNRKSRVFSLFSTVKSEDEIKREIQLATGSTPNNANNTTIQNPLFGKKNLPRTKSFKSSTLRPEDLRDMTESTATNNTSTNNTSNNTSNNSSSSNVNLPLNVTAPAYVIDKPTSNASIASKPESKWISTKSSSKPQLQQPFLLTTTRIIPIFILGDHSVGKLKLAQNCFLYDKISQTIPTPPPFKEISSRKRKARKMLPSIPHMGTLEVDGKIVHFSITSLYELTPTISYRTMNLFIVVYDITKPESFEYALQLMKEIQKNSENYSLFLVANKIEKLSQGGTMNSSSAFLSGFKTACEFNAKFISLCFQPLDVQTWGDFISNIIINANCSNHNNNLYQQNVQYYYPPSPSNSFLFDDLNPIQKEEFIYKSIDNINSTSEGKEEWVKHYVVIKGEFLISCDPPSNSIQIFYLPICNIKLIGQSRSKFCWEIKDKSEKSTVFGTDSLKSFSEWIYSCRQRRSEFENNSMYENIFQLFGDLQLQTTKPLNITDYFSSILHHSFRAVCVDCNTKGVNNYISKSYGVFLCAQCSSIHSRIFARDSRISAISDIENQKEIWELFHIHCNYHFNLLWEGKLSFPQNEYVKINKDSSIEERTHFIKDKYEKKRFYSCPLEPLIYLYLSSDRSESINLSNVKDCSSEYRYLDISPQYFIKLYSDREKQNLLYEVHISCCSFRIGRELGLPPSYFQIVTMSKNFLFKAPTAQLANRWNLLLQSCFFRSTLIDCKARTASIFAKRENYSLNNELSLNKSHLNTKVTNDPPLSARKKPAKFEGGKIKTMDENEIRLKSKEMTKDRVELLFKEKQTLRSLRDNYKNQLLLKDYLEGKLSETLNLLRELELNEIKSLQTISSIEPPSVQLEVSFLSTLVNGDFDQPEYSIAFSPSHSGDHGKLSTHNLQGGIHNGAKNRKNSLNNNQRKNSNGLQMEEGVVMYDSSTLLLNENGTIKGGTLNALVEMLIAKELTIENSYTDHFLKTFPSFTSSFEFARILCTKFSSPLQSYEIAGSNSGRKRLAIRLSDQNFQIDAFIKIYRVKILAILEAWISEYWKTDFESDFRLIAFIHSFLDNIVDHIEGFADYAQSLRSKINSSFSSSFLPLRSSTAASLIDLPPPSTPHALSGGVNHHVNNNNEGDDEGGVMGSANAKEAGGAVDSSPPPSLLKNSRTKSSVSSTMSSISPIDVIIELDPSDIVKQFCSLDHELYCKIRPRELLNKAWNGSQKDTLAPNIIALIDRFNRTSNWVSTVIVKATKLKQRVKIVERLIGAAQKARELANFHGVVAIIGGLQDPSVRRLKRTWEQVNSKLLAAFNDLVKLIKIDDNWGNYRKVIANLPKNQPCIPYIGVYLKDLIFIEDGLPHSLPPQPMENSKDNSGDQEDQEVIINYEKRRKIANIICEIQSQQKYSYNLPIDHNTRINIIASFFNIKLLNDEERYEESRKIEPKTAIAQKK